MSRYLLVAICAVALSGCLLREHGECDEYSNPKEHACRVPARYAPADPMRPDADVGMEPPSCGAWLAGRAVSGVLPAGPGSARGSCGGEGAENAFVFEAGWGGSYTFVTSDTSVDTVLYVLDGECVGSELGCDDDGGDGTASRVTVELFEGQRVTVIVDTYGSSDGGSYRLQVLGP